MDGFGLINELVASDSGSWQIYRIPPQEQT
jgi:hypothetical protein